MSEQPPLFSGDEPPGGSDPRWPRVYIACPLTAVADDQAAKNQLNGWIHIVKEAINEQTAGGDVIGETRSWTVLPDAPLDRSSPWKDKEADPEEIYQRNSRAVWANADGMIMIGFRGGSIGAGQEWEWALRTGIPILYLQPPREPVSRQVLGGRDQGDVTIEPFEEPDELKRIVARWLARRRPAIEDGERRRSMRRSRLLVAQTVLAHTWARLDLDGRADFCARTGLKPQFVNRLLTDLDALVMATAGQLADISAGLGVDLGHLLGAASPPDALLGPRQLRALQQAAAENAWDGQLVVDLILDAQHIFATPATRRLRLISMAEWVRLAEGRES